MTAYLRSSRYTARHILRLWAWGIYTEVAPSRTWRSRNRKTR